MLTVLRNIGKYSVAGFLLVAISGLTLSIHHEHAIENVLTAHEHSHSDGIALKMSPETYHEVHFIKLLSGDSFRGPQSSELNNSLVKLFVVQLNSVELLPIQNSFSPLHTGIRDTDPPSRDKYALFCSFLI